MSFTGHQLDAHITGNWGEDQFAGRETEERTCSNADCCQTFEADVDSDEQVCPQCADCGLGPSAECIECGEVHKLEDIVEGTETCKWCAEDAIRALGNAIAGWVHPSHPRHTEARPS